MPFLEVTVAHDTTEQLWDGADAVTEGKRSVGWTLAYPGYPRLYLTAHVLEARLHRAELSLESTCCEWPIVEGYSYGRPDGTFVCKGCGDEQEGRSPLLLANSQNGVLANGQETYEAVAASELGRWLSDATGWDIFAGLLEARSLLDECARLIEAARYDRELTPLTDL